MEGLQMLFNEIYSTYYNAMALLINQAIDGNLDAKNAKSLIESKAFQDSFLYIIDAVQKEQWQVITHDFKTPLKHYARMPVTLLQKRFLKAISLDRRFPLFFDGTIEGLEDVEPLYTDRDFYSFDVIRDGDPYEDPEYIAIFRTILRALKEKRKLKIKFDGGKGASHYSTFTPRKLEYSEKDDKFRLLCLGKHDLAIINLARITSCVLLEEYKADEIKPMKRPKCTLVVEITNERNALERCMLHFSNYEKQTRQTGRGRYIMEMTYYKSDETEVLIRVLSFGPMLKVLSPTHFEGLVKERLERQVTQFATFFQ